MNTKNISKQSLKWFLEIYKKEGVLIEGDVLKFINKEDLDPEEISYLDKAIENYKSTIDSRIKANTTLRDTNIELRETQHRLETLLQEYKTLKEKAEKKRNEAVLKLDDFIKKKHYELTGVVVKTMLGLLAALLMFTFGIYTMNPESTVIENLVSQVVMSTLASCFSIIGTLQAIKTMGEDSQKQRNFK